MEISRGGKIKVVKQELVGRLFSSSQRGVPGFTFTKIWPPDVVK